MKTVILALILFLGATACGNAQTNNKNVSNVKNKNTTVSITKADFLKKVVNYETTPNEWKYLGDKPAIVDFYANWCGPCKMIAPILDELAAEYGDSIVIYKVNTENERELAAAFGIRSIPALLFIPKNGKPTMAQGAMSKADFKKTIDELLLGK